MKRAALAALLLLFTGAGCDWIQYAFMNSIPFHGDPAKNPDVYVYIGADGLSYHATQEAIKRGAFSGGGWNVSKFISIFPATSDAAWTRIMHTEKLGGYEFEFYDPQSDTVKNKGLYGLALHILPVFADFINFEAKYLDAFDYRANGYLGNADAYQNTFVSAADSMDNIFALLEGRAETGDVFAGYMLEFDVMGHMKTFEDVVRALMNLGERIEAFKARHPERRFHFTLLSDHGLDYVKVGHDKMIKYDEEFKKLGIEVVDTLNGRDPTKGTYAIPIMHTRVTYLAVHTHPDLIEEIARKTSSLESVDVAVAKVKQLHTYGIWSGGALAAKFGFDPATDRYTLPKDTDWSRFGLDTKGGTFTDDELFKLTRDSRYPDLFYRVRTALSDAGVKYPAEVLLSMKVGYISQGYQMDGTEDIASSGFHGSLEDLGSLGTLLSDERELPPAVRSETFLDLFPRMRDHREKLRVKHYDGDPNSGLAY